MDLNFKKLLKKYEKESISSLQEWIKINSIYDENTVSVDKPFGEGVASALEYIARLGEENGFNVDRCSSYCTEISYGEGDLIAVYAHADVVPVSGDWDEDPFSGNIKNGIMYGRGTSDDKGPAMAAFYALKALKENDLIKGYKVSLVVGGNEERGSACLEHYFHKLHKPYPKYGFTPDGDFPLIYGEKGICNYVHKIPLHEPRLISFNAGVVANSVIDEAHCIINDPQSVKEKAAVFFDLIGVRYEIKDVDEGEEIIVYGKAAHGSMPELGVNAGLLLLKFIGWLFQNESLQQLASFYLEPTGRLMNCYYESEYLHGTTYNAGLINFENDEFNLVINFRYPENVDVKEVENKINKIGLGSVQFGPSSPVLLMDPNSPMIQTLLKVYQEETGDLKTPIMTIGGGTYAKESKNTIAFGSHFPGREDNIHSPNEKIHISDYLDSQSIYARAIYELGHLK